MKPVTGHFWTYLFLILAITGVTGCTGTYGRVQSSKDISEVFERHEVLANHSYYATGPEARPTAVLAIDRAYTLKPGLWRSVDMTPALLERLVDAMTDQLGFTPATLGGVITDPAGQRAGVWYSLYSRTTIRFEPGNVIIVSLPGPDRDPFRMNRNRRPGSRR
ncbi:hypothetical protein DSCA_26410 [Desulfosarcina alkanivorans]|jgi:hypothetical protein|uniref:Lipoprotein n=1 Tax=Desulfosarcina alkanivorans TaxID=571177 RepID=A0A5K7YP74_9BACT|nr:hypothetical protein [Desulfosarcina alkanivorans]BBO68711.1 hypothetical protein DSCA_26410 [Desulfosarcina alkanivorans]